MESINIKAGILTLVLLLFTYVFYLRQPLNFLSLGAAAGTAALVLIIALIYFFGTKFIGYAIQHKFYPNIALRMLLPFVALTLLSWLVYAFIEVKPFGSSKDFLAILSNFTSRHLLYIAVCTTLTSLTFSFPPQKDSITDALLLRQNLLFLVATIFAFVLSVFAVYKVKLIDQPRLDPKYTLYKSLNENQDLKHYELEQLPVSEPGTILDKPYLLAHKQELVLVSISGGSNRLPPVERIYKLDQNGKLINSVNAQTLISADFFPLVLQADGLLTDHSGKALITWIFDGNTSRQAKDRIVKSNDWVFVPLAESKTHINMVYFNKTAPFHCNNLKELKYNGNRYYDITLQKEILKIKVDSVFSHSDNLGNCIEKKLEYYSSAALNFSLLRLNEHEYYIIKPTP
ncbi:hypothetical protein [Pedobacter africanus]|uniref:Uncharacterized protein n=1 Tax=Pedobacter africanus TaxID=151894 RepID=A0A1W1Z0X7_9SPHI|nr:hypothetical protein [Pedobacter africanus]SMC41608.1 hypothetical protein SAMN04488524_0314 [Pedobacter africanus]